MSSRTAKRHLSNGTIPNFKAGVTSCLDHQGKAVIEQNMDNLVSSGIIDIIMNDDGLRLTGVLVDGVATEECIDVDQSQLPNQFVGLCLHLKESQFVSMADAERIERELDREGTDMSKVHFAKEMEVYCLCLNDDKFTFLLPVALIPTCKKDYEAGESTHTVKEVMGIIYKKYHELGLHKTLGPLATGNSDGASPFRKGMGQLLNSLIPTDIRRTYSKCKLFNVVGGEFGMTIACDLDHLGKRFRARVKTAIGIMIGIVPLNKTDLAQLLAHANIVRDASQAERLFDPEDNMDVKEMVECLDAIASLANSPWITFPDSFRSTAGNCTIYNEMRIFGSVARAMCAMIIGHEGQADEEGNHLSVSEYLAVCSRLSHLLFFLFRRNKTAFCAAQNYRNWQDTIKNMFVNVSVAKKHGVKHFWFFLNTNKRLEQLFGILRSLRRSNLNFSCLDLRDRLGDAVLIQWIYSEYPEWDQSSRRLTNSMDRKNTRSWKGCTLVANVDEVACWEKGRDDAIEILKRGGVFDDDALDIDFIVQHEPGVDMLRPYREQIGVLAGDETTTVVVDLSEAADDEYGE